MSSTEDSDAFKNVLCSMIFDVESSSKIREVSEAIRQMYDAYLTDVIDEVLTDEQEQNAYKALGKFFDFHEKLININLIFSYPFCIYVW